MRIIVFLILLSSQGIMAQNLIEFAVPDIEWKKWDRLFEDNESKLEFIRGIHFEYPKETGVMSSFTPKYAKILDIDGNGSLDLLYIEPATFQIYLNSEDTLRLIYKSNEKMAELLRSWPDAPLNFKTADFSCCEGEGWEFNYYHFAIQDNQFSYRIYRTEMIHQGTKDLFHNMPPTQIKIGASSAELATGPGETKVITTYKAGEAGYAAASMKAEDGKLWWKVFIKEDNYKLRVGWIEKNKLVPIYQSR